MLALRVAIRCFRDRRRRFFDIPHLRLCMEAHLLRRLRWQNIPGLPPPPIIEYCSLTLALHMTTSGPCTTHAPPVPCVSLERFRTKRNTQNIRETTWR